MSGDTSAGLRITVWRPYSAPRALAYIVEEPEKLEIFDGGSNLQQEVFAWQVKEDVWSGIADGEIRTNLQDKLKEWFDPFKSPEKRHILKMIEYAGLLDGAIKNGKSEWADSSVQISTDDDGDALRFNPLIAFMSQIIWICNIYSNVPGASISVR